MQIKLLLTDTVMQILVALGNGPLHGYAIMKQIKMDTGIAVNVTTLYRNIRSMLEQDFIEEIGLSMPADVRRRSYRLTEHGIERGQAQLNLILNFTHIAQDRLIK